jgi:hypothetical protein
MRLKIFGYVCYTCTTPLCLVLFIFSYCLPLCLPLSSHHHNHHHHHHYHTQRFAAEYLAALYLQRASLSLPSQEQQRQWLREYELALLAKGYSDDKYHYMGDGDDQWRYCRFLATEAGLMGSSSNHATNDPKWFVRTDESESANTSASASASSSASANASSIISISSTMFPCSPPIPGIPVPVPGQEDVCAVSRYINKLETLYNKNLSLRPKYPGDNDTYRSVSYENEVLCNL